jgi:hypothetical protein
MVVVVVVGSVCLITSPCVSVRTKELGYNRTETWYLYFFLLLCLLLLLKQNKSSLLLHYSYFHPSSTHTQKSSMIGVKGESPQTLVVIPTLSCAILGKPPTLLSVSFLSVRVNGWIL